MNVFRVHSRAARFALALLLAFATQVAVAGDLCRAVVVGGGGAGMPQAGHAMAGGPADAGFSALPCCEDAQVALVKCARAEPAAAGSTLDKPQLSGAAPSFDAFLALRVGEPRHSALPAAAPAAPSVPAYILFGRFLS